MSTIRLKEQGTTPADAAAGQIQMYAKTDGKLYTKQGGNSEQNLAVGDDISGLNLGKVLQVVTGTQSSSTTHAGNASFATTDLKADITLSSASSLVYVSFHLNMSEAGSTNNRHHGWVAAIYRTKDGGSAVNIADGGPGTTHSYYGMPAYNTLINWSWTDTPAPTSTATPLRYEIYFKSLHLESGMTTTTHSNGQGNSNATSQITLMEIGG